MFPAVTNLWRSLGDSLVSADFDNDGFDDVIIGAGEAIGSKENAGAFTICSALVPVWFQIEQNYFIKELQVCQEGLKMVIDGQKH